MLVSASKDSTLKVRLALLPPSLLLAARARADALALLPPLPSRLAPPFSLLAPQLWDLKTFKIRVDLPGHSDEVYCVDFVADKIASGGRDKKVKMCVALGSLSPLSRALETSCAGRLVALLEQGRRADTASLRAAGGTRRGATACTSTLVVARAPSFPSLGTRSGSFSRLSSRERSAVSL